MFLYLFMLSLARLVSSDLAALRRFAEGGPAPLAKPNSEPIPTNTQEAKPAPQVLNLISNPGVQRDVAHSSGIFGLQSTPTFIPGVPFGARQVGGQSFSPIKLKNVVLLKNLPHSNQFPSQAPPHASWVDILRTSTPPPPTAVPVSSQYTKSLEQHAKLLEQHAKSLEAQLGLVRLSKSRVNTPAVATTVLPHTAKPQQLSSSFNQDSESSLVLFTGNAAVVSVTEVTREQQEEELRAAVRLLRGNWDFLKKGGRLVLTDENDPLVIASSLDSE